MADTALARARFTLDSNILIYAFNREDASRHRPAMEIVNRAVDADCWLTLQALSEFYAVATRKRMLSLAEAAAQVEDWLVVFPCIAVSAAAVRRALADAVAGRASYWDALLVATAAESGCTVVLSEEHGRWRQFRPNIGPQPVRRGRRADGARAGPARLVGRGGV